MPREPEPFRTAYFDPGEDFGWALGHDLVLLARGTEKMRVVEDAFWDLLSNPSDPDNLFNEPGAYRAGVDWEAEIQLPVGRVVMENWRLYPDKLPDLAWDECRTARAIGAIQFMCRQHRIPCVTQPAAIKPAAEAAGAHELYDKPLTENRHQNDAIQHFVFYTNTELLGLFMPVKDSKTKAESPEHHPV